MKTSTYSDILKTLRDDGADSLQSMLDALQDGDYLAMKGWGQKEVEEAFFELTQVRKACEAFDIDENDFFKK